MYKTGRTKPAPHQRMKRATISPSKLPAAPASFIPPPVEYGMFGNDTYGNCVIAQYANTELQHAVIEKRQLSFTVEELIAFYFYQTGGVDSGLVETDFLANVEEYGFPGDGRRKTGAVIAIDPQNIVAVQSLIAVFGGLYAGVELPMRAQVQLEAGQPWDLPGSGLLDEADEPGSWSGHCVGLFGFVAQGPLLGTWGKLQPASWRWYQKYCDEVYIKPSRELLIAEPTLADVLGVAVAEDSVA